MSVEGLIASFIIILAFLIWILIPFLQRDNQQELVESSVDRQRERLQLYYERVLRNLHDIDEDYATGKLNEDEYTVEREQWVQRGIMALKALDELDEQHLIAPAEADSATVDEAIETVMNA